MKRKNILLLLFCVLGITACHKSEVETWNNMGAIRFANADTTRFTFAYLEGDETVLEIPMVLEGEYASRRREVAIKVAREVSNELTRYEILTPVELEANADTAWLKIKIYRTENLQQERDTLTLQIESSKDLLAGDKDYLLHTLTLYDRIEEPSWWREPFMGLDYLGEFSELKMQIIQEVFGTTDYFPFDYTMLMQFYPDNYATEYTYRVYRFKNFVAENYPEVEWGYAYDWL